MYIMTQIQEITSKLNILRNKFSNIDFTSETWLAAIRAENIPYPTYYLGRLVRSKHVEKHSRGVYRFVERPIHIEWVTQIHKEVSTIVSNYNKTHCEKINSSKTPEKDPDKIAQAINLLKSTGEYKILKQCTDYREI